MSIKVKSLKSSVELEKIFDSSLFPRQILSKADFFNENVWMPLFQPSLGDPIAEDASISSDFAFILVTEDNQIPDELRSIMHIFEIIEVPQLNKDNNTENDPMSVIATLHGGVEIVR